MPSLADLFNPTFLMFLGILLLVVCLLVLYFENKMREQNHKIASMLSLVSSLAEEVNGVKFGINHLVMRGGDNTMGPTFVNDNKLVVVSDDEEDEEEDEEDNVSIEEEESDNVSIEEEELESVDSDDSSSLVESDNEELVLEDIKVLKLNIGNTQEEMSVSSHELSNLDIEEMDDLEELNDEDSIVGSSKSTVITNDPTSQLDINSSDLKTININLEEHIENVDYKKMALPKLRSIVEEKGLVKDASKLKKNELLKLLEVE